MAILAAKYVELVAGEPHPEKWSRQTLWATQTMYTGMVRTYGMEPTDQAIEQAQEIRRMIIGPTNIKTIPW